MERKPLLTIENTREKVDRDLSLLHVTTLTEEIKERIASTLYEKQMKRRCLHGPERDRSSG